MKKFRRKIFLAIDTFQAGNRLNALYDYVMMAAIVLSLVPLAFKESNFIFVLIESITVTLFMIDYILRELTADFKLKKGSSSFLLYPFTLMALVDLLAILPSFFALSSSIKLFKLFRLPRTLRVFRVLKMVRYSKSCSIISDVIKTQRAPLLAVCTLTVGYVLVSALVIFNVEPETFQTFFDAVYWATISLTTMGYGDIYAVTTAGKVVTMLSSVVGIAIIALPAGIIIAGYLDEIKKPRH